jgi:hypothetical protein
MSYNANMIARAEHNLRVNSQPTVSEFGESVIITPGWFRRQVDRLMLKFAHRSARPAEIDKPSFANPILKSS